MLIDLDRETMLRSMTERQLLTASADILGAVLPEAAGYGYLTRVGLPHYGGLFLIASTVIDDADAFEPSAVAPETELGISEWQGRSLLLIGYTVVRDASIHVDRETGEVFASPGQEEEYELINGDVSSLGFLLLTVLREIPDQLADYDTDACAANVRAAVNAVDPIPFGDPGSLWNEYFDAFLY